MKFSHEIFQICLPIKAKFSMRFNKLEVLRHEILFQSYLNSFRFFYLSRENLPWSKCNHFWPNDLENRKFPGNLPNILRNEIFSWCCINVATTTATAGIMLVTQLCWRLKVSDDNWMSVTEHRSWWFFWFWKLRHLKLVSNNFASNVHDKNWYNSILIMQSLNEIYSLYNIGYKLMLTNEQQPIVKVNGDLEYQIK